MPIASLTLIILGCCAVCGGYLTKRIRDPQYESSRHYEWYVMSGKVNGRWGAWARLRPLSADDSKGPVPDDASFVVGGWTTRAGALERLHRDIRLAYRRGEFREWTASQERTGYKIVTVADAIEYAEKRTGRKVVSSSFEGNTMTFLMEGSTESVELNFSFTVGDGE